MSKLSEFYGIVIYMYYRDHSPPHFHANYGEYEVLIKLKDFSEIQGNIPNRALKLIKEWASIHKIELT